MSGEELLQLLNSNPQGFITQWNTASKSSKDKFSDLMYSTIKSTGASPAESKEAYRRIIHDQASSDTLVNALKTGVGLTQVFAGFFEKGRLTRPTDPPITPKNSNLATLQAIATSKATGNDPNARELLDSKMASGQAVDSANARASGSIGQYTGNIQGASVRRDQSLRQFMDDEDKRKLGWMNQAGNLTAQSIAEDRTTFEQMMQQFRMRMQEYTSSKDNKQAQINSGVSNVFAGLEGGSEAYPYLKGTQAPAGPESDLPAMPAPETQKPIYNMSEFKGTPHGLTPEGSSVMNIEKPSIDMSALPKRPEKVNFMSPFKPTRYDGIMAMAGVPQDEKVIRGFQEEAVGAGYEIPIMELGKMGTATKKYLESLNY